MDLIANLNKEGFKLPADDDMEQGVLGALLLEKTAIHRVSGIIDDDDFFNPVHQRIMSSILELEAGMFPVDILTVADNLKKGGSLDLVGGVAILAELTNRVGSTVHLSYHCAILKTLSMRRKLIKGAQEIILKGFDYTTDDMEVLDFSEKLITEISGQNAVGAYKQISKTVIEMKETHQNLLDNPDETLGIRCASEVLTKVLQGWRGGKLYVFAARPGMGKTSFFTNEVKFAAVQLGIPIGFFSFEMSDTEITAKVIASEMEINDKKINDPRLANDIELAKIDQGYERVGSAPIYINEMANTIGKLKSAIRILVRDKGIRMAIVDYIQLMTVEGNQKQSREQEVSSISRQLKLIAKELDIPIIALSQLSRAVETRGGSKRPILSDLRESGAIEQDADVVGFFYRPEYYNILEDDEGLSLKGLCELIISKHRGGPLKNIQLGFIPEHSRFTNWNAEFAEPEKSKETLQLISSNGNGQAINGNGFDKTNDDEDIPF